MANGSWINSVNCFEQHASGGTDYSIGYCLGNLMIQLCSYVLMAQVVALLAWHMQRKGWLSWGTYSNSKTWLLLLLVAFVFIVTLRYTFNLYAFEYFYSFLLVA